jgi:signal transduction histidine kinase
MTFTLLFSAVGWFFGLVMGILYSGLCFLFGGYAHQVLKAEAAHEQNEQMITRLEAAHRQLQGYARQKAGLAVEHQRNRLARDLHDSVTQTIFSMNLAAQSARLLVDQESPRAAEQLLRIEELAASALQEIQSLVSKLGPRSLDEESLPDALRRLAAEQQRQAGLHISMEIQGEADLPDAVAASLYCIAQEALINVSKHSGVCEAIVRLSLREHGSYLQIEDPGNGFDPESARDRRGHLGLAVMTERAREVGWHLAIRSQPGQGTCIRVTESPAGALP